MNRIPGKAGMALLGIASAALVAFPIEGSAQSGLEDQRRSLEALGAAIAEVKRSPFHRVVRARPHVNPRAVVRAAWRADNVALVTGSVPSSPQRAAQADSADDGSRYATIAAMLGIAAGDLISLGLAANSGTEGMAWASFFVLSPSLTALATSWAGVSPGASVASSFLGHGLGIGTGLVTAYALAEPLYYAAIIPAAIVYYGVRLGVTLALTRRLERESREWNARR